MSSFQKLYNEVTTRLDSEKILTEAPEDGASVPDNNVQPQVPKPDEVKQEQPAGVTTEGKKFLVELALKALSVDPSRITPTDKDIFTTEITIENAEEILQRIQSIVEVYG